MRFILALAALLTLVACTPPIYRGACVPIAEQVLGCVFKPMTGSAADEAGR